jgi:large subunit ribosomal protein L18
MGKAIDNFNKRKERNRYKLSKRDNRFRLSVFRSSKHIYAQIIDDSKGVTLVSASSIDKNMKSSIAKGNTVKSAAEVGKELAKRAKTAGIEKVKFDRGGYKFHGRVKALADGARELGLQF